MSEIFKCSICGKEYNDLTSYVKCVSSCAEDKFKREKEDELKRLLDGINDAIDTVNNSKNYLEYRLNEFKDKFPDEYLEYYPKLMSKKECRCNDEGDNCSCEKNMNMTKKEDEVVNSFFVEIDSTKGAPEIKARINGKSVDKDEALKLLESNSEVMNFAKKFGIFQEIK